MTKLKIKAHNPDVVLGDVIARTKGRFHRISQMMLSTNSQSEVVGVILGTLKDFGHPYKAVKVVFQLRFKFVIKPFINSARQMLNDNVLWILAACEAAAYFIGLFCYWFHVSLIPTGSTVINVVTVRSTMCSFIEICPFLLV